MESTSLTEENVLLRKIAEGDEKAFRNIYDSYRKRIFSYAYSLTESDDLAGELVQEVFLKVWINRSKLTAVANFNSWIYRIAKNLFLDALRKKAAEEKGMRNLKIIREDRYEAEDFVLTRENENLLKELTSKLPPQQKQIFQLKTEGYKLDEIAEKLNISKNTVKVHLNRAITTLKKHLNHNRCSSLIILLILISRS